MCLPSFAYLYTFGLFQGHWVDKEPGCNWIGNLDFSVVKPPNNHKKGYLRVCVCAPQNGGHFMLLRFCIFFFLGGGELSRAITVKVVTGFIIIDQSQLRKLRNNWLCYYQPVRRFGAVISVDASFLPAILGVVQQSVAVLLGEIHHKLSVTRCVTASRRIFTNFH